MFWKEYIDRLYNVSNSMIVSDDKGKVYPHDEGFGGWTSMTEKIRDQKKTIFFIGNGASASMASHFSADLSKQSRIHTEVFTDPVLMTAVANDIEFKYVFSKPLDWRMKPGDMLVAISSSGNSPNILAGAKMARDKDGKVVTLSAMKEGNPLRKLGDLNFYVPGRTYGQAESVHSVILHYWMDLVEYESMGVSE